MSLGLIPLDPRGFARFEDWSSLTAFLLAQIGFALAPIGEKDWQFWARQVRLLPDLAALNVPDPMGFRDWRDWALRLNEAIRLL